MISFLASHPDVSAFSDDICVRPPRCAVDLNATRGQYRRGSWSTRWRPGLTLLAKGPCNTCFLPHLVRSCFIRAVALVRNPLNYWASLTRRLPASPHRNMQRWVADHAAIAQDWRRMHVMRYEDATAADDAIRAASFRALFDFLGLTMNAAMEARISVRAADGGTLGESGCYQAREGSQSSESLTGAASAARHVVLRACERTLPLLVNTEPWRRQAEKVAAATAIAARVANETAAFLPLVRALGYLREDPLLRTALAYAPVPGARSHASLRTMLLTRLSAAFA